LGILREEVADFKQNTKASSVDLEGVEKMLRSDDRVLGRLGRLADGVIVSGDEGAEGNEVVERVTVLVKKYGSLLATLSILDSVNLKSNLIVAQAINAIRRLIKGPTGPHVPGNRQPKK
jgi:hypothetical protein